ncbi:DUF4160 domain-containing protein [Methyloprofundus sp.]|uniref:DUF4160 domain-containing protein n=1 Tax=Methyloprofundus sp. TaxID=2020875 RepID=UPI003D11EE49
MPLIFLSFVIFVDKSVNREMKDASFRFFFYSNENGEPAHIHIQRERMLAKFWLKPVALASSTRFSPK